MQQGQRTLLQELNGIVVWKRADLDQPDRGVHRHEEALGQAVVPPAAAARLVACAHDTIMFKLSFVSLHAFWRSSGCDRNTVSSAHHKISRLNRQSITSSLCTEQFYSMPPAMPSTCARMAASLAAAPSRATRCTEFHKQTPSV